MQHDFCLYLIAVVLLHCNSEIACDLNSASSSVAFGFSVNYIPVCLVATFST